MDAVKEVVVTASIDDNPALTASVAGAGCNAHDNTKKVTVHSPLGNPGVTTVTTVVSSTDRANLPIVS